MKNKEKTYSITAIIIIIDQLIKIVVNRKLPLEKNYDIIPNFLSIYHVDNTGAAFSILTNQVTLLIVLSLIILFILYKYIEKEKNFTKLSTISLGLIMGGIVGNLIDRLLFGKVIDYISLKFGSYLFPVFNIADTAIVIGVILMIISIIKEEKDKKKVPVIKVLEEKNEVIKREKRNKNDKSKRKPRKKN